MFCPSSWVSPLPTHKTPFVGSRVRGASVAACNGKSFIFISCTATARHRGRRRPELPDEGQSMAGAVWDTGRRRDLGCRGTGMGLGSPGAPVPVPCVVPERWRGRTGQQRFADCPLRRGTAETVLGLAKGERALMLHLAGLRDPTASPKATGEDAQRDTNPWWAEPLNDASKEKCRPTCKNETMLPPTM